MRHQPNVPLALALASLALFLAACGGGGGSGSSDIRSAPAHVRIEPASRTAIVSWDAVPGASSYHVYLAGSPAVSPDTYDDLPEGKHAPGVEDLTIRFEGLAEGGTYWAIVAAESESGEGPASAPVSATLPVGVVRDLAARGGVSSVRLTWALNRGATGYEVFVGSTASVSPTSYERRFDTVGVSVLVDGLQNGTPYFFVARALNGNGPGPTSQPVTGVPDGRGTIESVTAFEAGGGTTGLVLADLNGDGIDEILVANEADGTVRAFAPGTSPRDPFTPLGEFSLFGDVPAAIGVLDADADGVLDLAVARRGVASVTVHHGYGDGTFEESPLWTIAVGAEPVDLVIADVDGNGFSDVLTADHAGATASLALGQSTVPYTRPVVEIQDVFGWVPVFDEFGNYLFDDWQVIGTEEVVVGMEDVYPDPFQPTVKAADASAPVALAVADVDGDLDADLLVVEASAPRLLVLKNDGTGAFSLSQSIDLSSRADSIELADANGDGFLDAVLASSDGACTFLFRNDGTGQFSGNASTLTGASPVATITTDMNGDAIADVVVADLTAGTITIYLGNGFGGYEKHFQMVPGSSAARIRATDVDGDGVMDLVVTDPTAGSVLILYGSKV